MTGLPIDLTVFLLVFVRVGAVMMLLPIFSDPSVPMRLRLFMALGFSLGMYGILAGKVAPALVSEQALPGLVVSEMMVGLAIGAIVSLMFQAMTIAGALVNFQVGLSSALVNDPTINGQTPVLARITTLAAVIVCMALGVHHLWIASIVQSYGTFPVGGLPPSGDFAQLAIQTVGRSMTLAVGLAAPMLIYGIVFNMGVGLVARMAPGVQIFFMIQPLNIALGLCLFMLTLGAVLLGFGNAMADFIRDGWQP